MRSIIRRRVQKTILRSVTEGDDKPRRYPDRFHVSDLMLPHIDFDIAACFRHARRLDPDIEIPTLSARAGEEPDRRPEGNR